MHSSSSLDFDNTYARDLVGLYKPWPPVGFPEPELVSFNDAVLAELGLPEHAREQAALWFSGSVVPEGAEPLAMAYAGHQFGGFSPQLGDGRALLLGEVLDPRGRRWDIQLKGSGRTPFSRGGDGLATLGPILREHLVSEAMHHLGIPTTRVLATVRTGNTVFRQGPLPGAVLARVASSHLRVGTLQFFAARGEREKLVRLVRYAVQRHLPEGEGSAIDLLRHVAQNQAVLIASWMNVGFVHGVMNTDNFTLSGETIDYGPCAFLDVYDPSAVFSSIDRQGRYAFGAQPAIGQWNLARLGEALLPLLHEDEPAAIALVEQVLVDYATAFTALRLQGLRDKLGLVGEEDADPELVQDLLRLLQGHSRDHTASFRALSRSLREGSPAFCDADFRLWHTRWLARLDGQPLPVVAERMDAVNPVYIPRNHLVEHALDAAVVGDMAPFRTLMEVLASPYEERPGLEAFTRPAPSGSEPYVTYCGT